MRLSDLVIDLTDILEDMGDMPVRVATQPSYPTENEITAIAVPEVDYDDDPLEEQVLYIGVGGNEGYLPGFVRDFLREQGWRN